MEKREKEHSYAHILKYTGLFGGVQGLNIIVGLVRNKLIAVILGPDGMGLVSLFNATIKLVSDSTNFGISVSAIKNISEAVGMGNERRVIDAVKLVRCWSLLTALLGTVLCLSLSPWLSDWTFSWGNHTLHFVFLSPVVGLLAITGGEAAILKGAQRLKSLAAISVYNVIFSTVLSVPLYYFFGQSGIVPSLVLLALLQCLLTIGYSYRLFRPSFDFSLRYIKRGEHMVRLGVAFVMAGILGSGADFLVRSYLNHAGELTAVGLYNAGYVMTMTYAGVVFSALEVDYFPRLSGMQALDGAFYQLVNRQAEVCLMLVAPLLVLFAVGLPAFLPLLYSGKFLPVLGMMNMTIFAMYFRALTLPVEYIALARGDSRAYLFLEAIYDLLIVVGVIIGYGYFGLTGTGAAIAVVNIVNLFVVYLFAYYRYGHVPSREVRICALWLLPLGLATALCCHFLYGWWYWGAGVLSMIIVTIVSLKLLRSKSDLWLQLTQKITRKIHRH